MSAPVRRTAPVAGGELTYGEWRADAPGTPVLAIHGITSSHLAWPFVADRLEGVRVVAPDLRGRAGSNGLPGPFGLRVHADDMAAVLDAAGIDRAVVVGHSMGAFVAVRFAELLPERVESLVLVDGGLPIPPPAGMTPEEAAAATLGPALERLSMTFESVEVYREFWRKHPGIGPYWSDEIESYVDYDLVGEAPELRASANPEAIAENSLQLDGTDDYAAALMALETPIAFVRAPRGLFDQPEALYAPETVDAWRDQLHDATFVEAEGVNHYTVIMGDHGAEQVAPVIADRLDAARTKEIA